MAGISLLIQGITDLATAAENAKQKVWTVSQNALSNYSQSLKILQSQKQLISSLPEDYVQLSKGVDAYGNNISLTTDEYIRYNQIVNEVAETFPDLIAGWDENNNAILKTGTSLKELTKTYQNNQMLAADTLVASGTSVFDNFKNNKTVRYNKSSLDNVLALADDKEALEAEIDDLKNWNTIDIIDGATSSFDYLHNALIDAGISRLDLITDGYTNVIIENKDMLQAYANSLQTTLSQDEDNMNSLMQGYVLRSSSPYYEFTEAQKQLFNGISSKFSISFYDEFDNVNEMYAKLDQIMEDIQGPQLADQFTVAFDMQTKFNNGEVSVEEYRAKIKEFADFYSKQGLDPKTEQSLSSLFNLHIDYDGEITYSDNIQKAIDKLSGFEGTGKVNINGIVNRLTAPEINALLEGSLDAQIEDYLRKNQNATAQQIADYISGAVEKADIIAKGQTAKMSLPDIYEGIQSSASLAAKAQREMADAGTVSLDTMMSLINAGLLTENQFIRTANGYSLADDALNSLNSAVLKNYQLSVQNSLHAAAAILDTQEAQKTAYEGNTEAILAQLEAQKQLITTEGFNKFFKGEITAGDLLKQIQPYTFAINNIKNALGNLETAESFYNDIVQESLAATQQAKWKESVDQAFRDLEHRHSMGLISEAAYLDALEQLNNRYYKNSTEYENEYQSYLEQIHNGRLQLTRDRISKEFSNLEHQHNMGLISEAAYLDKLEQLNNQYYKNNAEYESEYQSNLEQIRSGRLQLTRDLFAGEQAELQRQRDRGKISEWEYLNELEKLDEKYYKDRQDFLEDSLQVEDEILQGRLSLYQEAYDQLGELVDKQAEKIRSEKEAEKQALQEQLDALKEYYDQRKQELRDEAEQEDNLQNEAEMKQTIADLERRVNSLRLSTSAVDVRRRLELEQELADAREELEEFQEERRLEEAEKALDEEYEKEAEKLQSQIDTIDEYLENEYQVQQDALNELKQIKDFSRQSALYQRMRDWNRTEGTGKDEDIDQLFSNVQNILTALGTGTFGGAMSFLKGQVDAGQHSFAGGTTGAPRGFAVVDERGYEAKLVNPRRGRYQFLNDGDVVFTRRESLLLKQLTGSAGATLIGQRLAGMLQQGAQAASSLLRPAVALPVAIQTGDIVINGNADNRTVAALKAAQKSMTYQILKEFKKLK